VLWTGLEAGAGLWPLQDHAAEEEMKPPSVPEPLGLEAEPWATCACGGPHDDLMDGI
jgi:hypothetical protein